MAFGEAFKQCVFVWLCDFLLSSLLPVKTVNNFLFFLFSLFFFTIVEFVWMSMCEKQQREFWIATQELGETCPFYFRVLFLFNQKC